MYYNVACNGCDVRFAFKDGSQFAQDDAVNEVARKIGRCALANANDRSC